MCHALGRYSDIPQASRGIISLQTRAGWSSTLTASLRPSSKCWRKLRRMKSCSGIYWTWRFYPVGSMARRSYLGMLPTRSFHASTVESPLLHTSLTAYIDMGQGAAQAVEDAAALGVCFPAGSSPEEVPLRLRLWERCRKERADWVQEVTRIRGRDPSGKDGPPQTCKMMSFS